MAITKGYFYLLALLILVTVAPSQASSNHSLDSAKEKPVSHSDTSSHESMRRFEHLLHRHKGREPTTCDKFPRVCRAKGSAGPDCCKKHCVNVMTDNHNCGECGRKCRYGYICCHGSCVDVMFDRKNCGACKHKCKKGSFCSFGMCSYA